MNKDIDSIKHCTSVTKPREINYLSTYLHMHVRIEISNKSIPISKSCKCIIFLLSNSKGN